MKNIYFFKYWLLFFGIINDAKQLNETPNLAIAGGQVIRQRRVVTCHRCGQAEKATDAGRTSYATYALFLPLVFTVALVRHLNLLHLLRCIPLYLFQTCGLNVNENRTRGVEGDVTLGEGPAKNEASTERPPLRFAHHSHLRSLL